MRDLKAREVIISAGALHSPAILLRAGIGPAGHLRQMGIPVVVDLPGVGENLMDHPHIGVGALLTKHARLPAGPEAAHLLRPSLLIAA